MATFRVGQRVRIIGAAPNSGVALRGLIGREATIIAIPGSVSWIGTKHDCNVDVDGECRKVSMHFENLAPLTDPNAERFIESLKKLAREPLPLTKEKAQ